MPEQKIVGGLVGMPEAIDPPLVSRNEAPSLQYIANLDGLRGVAVLMVLASHTIGFFGGMLGVDVFFVLSGFLITNLLLREFADNTPLAVFYWRRFLRLMPALLVVSVVVFAAYPLLPGTGSRSCELAAPLMGVANWTTPFNQNCPVYMGHSWSLGVEEQFYLLWPVLLFVCLKTVGRRGAVAVALALACICAAWRADLFLNGAPIQRIYWPFDTRCDGMLVGAAAALLMAGDLGDRIFRLARALWIPAAACAAAIAFVAVSHAPFFEGGYLLFAVLAAVVIVAASRRQRGTLDLVLSNRPLVYLGTLSYSFYLWHYPIVLYLVRMPGNFWGKFATIFALSFVAAYLSRRFVERPMLQFRSAVEARPWLGWCTSALSACLVLLGLAIYWPA